MSRLESGTFSHHELFDDFLHEVVVLLPQDLHVGLVHGRLRVTPRTKVLVDAVGLHLQDADAVAVEPVSAAFTADVESEIINKNMRKIQAGAFLARPQKGILSEMRDETF